MSISLISYHEKGIHLNSLISYHEYINVTYQSCNLKHQLVTNKISYKLTGSRMYKLSKTSKRPREEPARPIPTIDHSRRVRSNTSASTSSSGTRNPATSSSSTTAGSAAMVNPSTKEKPAKKFREKIYDLERACPMCSDSQGTIRHHHYSSTEIRRMFLDQGTQTTYPCPICHDLEPVVVPPMEVRRIVLSDSSLHGVWNQTLPTNTVHFDIDVIVGGKVRDMGRAFDKNYKHMPNRMEIVVVAGLNNIGAGETAEQIIAEMEELKQMVGEHSKRWNHNPPSYVVFCTVLFAPKFCSLQLPDSPGSDLANPEIAEWYPPPTFNNRYLETRKLNDLIISKNKEGGAAAHPSEAGLHWHQTLQVWSIPAQV